MMEKLRRTLRRNEVGERRNQVRPQRDNIGSRSSEVGLRTPEVNVRSSELGARRNKVRLRRDEVRTRRSEVGSRNPEIERRRDDVGKRENLRFSSWKHPRDLSICLVVSFLGACSVGPIYHGPPAAENAAPAHYKNANHGTAKSDRGGKEVSGDWWKIFRDSQLDRLEITALGANQDLRIAAARITEGRAQASEAAADFFPTIDLNSRAERTRTSNNLPFQKGELIGRNPFGGGMGGGGNGGPDVINTQPRTTIQNDFRLPAELNWEVDLFGRVRHEYAAARAQAEAIADDYRAMQLSVTANVATAYFTLRALDSELGVLNQTVQTREGALKIAQERLQAGLTSDLDLTRAQTELAVTQAAGFSVQRARAEMENALSTLLGEPASNFRLPPRPLTGAAPKIPAGIPSDLLERRPDVAAAERSLAAENERIGIAVADFFPRLRLTGAGGLESADFGLVFNASSRFWQIGPNLVLPIFEGGRNVANLQAEKARYEQSLGRYRQQLLVGFQEVENVLVDLRTISGEAEAQGRAVAAAQRTLDLSQQQYQKGAINFIDVLDAQRTLLQGQRTQTQLLGQRMQATVQLIKALGGDWR